MLKTILLVMITILLVMITVMIVVIISSYIPNSDQKSTVLTYDYVYEVQRMQGSKKKYRIIHSPFSNFLANTE